MHGYMPPEYRHLWRPEEGKPSGAGVGGCSANQTPVMWKSITHSWLLSDLASPHLMLLLHLLLLYMYVQMGRGRTVWTSGLSFILTWVPAVRLVRQASFNSRAGHLIIAWFLNPKYSLLVVLKTSQMTTTVILCAGYPERQSTFPQCLLTHCS